jgi:hypothetical protein
MYLHSSEPVYTVLKNRILWFDGDNTIKSKEIEIYLNIPNTFVDEITPEIQKYNKFIDKSQRKTIKDTCRPLNFDWNVPNEYLKMDVKKYIIDKLENILINYSEKEATTRISRVLIEYRLYKRLNLINIFDIKN